MEKIVEIKFGSHLYGTDTPASDIDIKSIYLPSAEDILLQRVKNSISTKRAKGDGKKNYAGEIEEEAFSLQKYFQLLAEGQTVATDLLFAPSSSQQIKSHIWDDIQKNSSRLVTRKSSAFVGYCRQQANKYGIKGSRVAAIRVAFTLLTEALLTATKLTKLEEIHSKIESLLPMDHMALVDVPQVNGSVIRHWEICGRKYPYNTRLIYVYDYVKALFDEYGTRALQAEKNEGVDWKALSHAVRVATQAVELLENGKIFFPLKNAEHLRNIKLGRYPYKQVAEEIEQGLKNVELASVNSKLPEHPDYEWMNNRIIEYYGAVIRKK